MKLIAALLFATFAVPAYAQNTYSFSQAVWIQRCTTANGHTKCQSAGFFQPTQVQIKMGNCPGASCGGVWQIAAEMDGNVFRAWVSVNSPDNGKYYVQFGLAPVGEAHKGGSTLIATDKPQLTDGVYMYSPKHFVKDDGAGNGVSYEAVLQLGPP